jgi:hypothetical protein
LGAFSIEERPRNVHNKKGGCVVLRAVLFVFFSYSSQSGKNSYEKKLISALKISVMSFFQFHILSTSSPFGG